VAEKRLMNGTEFWTKRALIGVVETLEVMLGVKARMVEVEDVPTVRLGLMVKMEAEVPEATPRIVLMEVVPWAEMLK
jgi:hypothetical protein